MARTRASKANNNSPANADNSTTSTTSTSKSKYTLPPPSNNPPKIFILPKKATPQARIASLLHPRHGKPTRYLVCPETGFYEFTRIAAPKSTPHSWLIQADAANGHHEPTTAKTNPERDNTSDNSFGTYVTNGAELFVATPIDPLFLILPTLVDESPSSSSSSGKSTGGEKRRYISSDDHFDRIQDRSPHLWEVLRWGSEGEGKVRSLLEAALAAVCDTVQAGDERMFRFSEDRLADQVLRKARRMSSKPLPRSMEERFVVKPLEAPVLGVKREVAVTTTVTDTATATATTATTTTTSTEVVVGATQDESSSTPASASGTPGPKLETSETQSSVSSTESSTAITSEASTAATSIAPSPTPGDEDSALLSEALAPAMVASPQILLLQRLRTSINFLCSSYVPPSLTPLLRSKLPASEFLPLDTYISELSRLKQEAAAARSAGDFARKRVLDDEEVAERAEKKRRKEEEDKRKKAGESRGVRELKKVNTAGMRKMSDFFKKKT